MENDNEKTHVLMFDCIISELGRCEAGSMLSESDVHSGTLVWLNEQGFLKSVSEIEAEADAEPTTEETSVVPKGRTAKKTIPAAE